MQLPDQFIVTTAGAPGRRVLAGLAAGENDGNETLQQAIVNGVVGDFAGRIGLNAAEQ